ncbi:hypothetical protein SAMN05421829_108135 [Aromatoleum tolulyticum]|uniref:Uncharacterized protein n=1 Tax=Aromatoleum tolulyticum TaxID=34027 RepID=A0A1N6WZN6_9RHOO|nr:hypothetical protein [Aromatoleum tolulyticum]SIQ95523.1 hypothetical protein SAMN05421829_108135 [Aromatoleum tolulyticum]
MTTPADLHGRILARIAKSTGQRPSRAADVLAMVGGAEPGFWAAVEQLYRERRINTAHIQKKGDPEPWLALWPTGLPPSSSGWTSNSHTALFVKPRADDLFQAFAPRSAPKPAVAPKPAPAKKTETKKEPVMDTPTNARRAHGTLQAELAKHLTGVSKADSWRVSQLAEKMFDDPQNIRFALKALVAKGELAVIEVQNGGRTAAAYYDPATEPAPEAAPASLPEEPVPAAVVTAAAEVLTTIAEAAAPAPVEPEPAAIAPTVERRAPTPLYRAGDLTVMEVAEPPAPERVEFALWDDGRLTIAAQNEILLIPADATKRLALLLGVPGNQPVSNLGA